MSCFVVESGSDVSINGAPLLMIRKLKIFNFYFNSGLFQLPFAYVFIVFHGFDLAII